MKKYTATPYARPHATARGSREASGWRSSSGGRRGRDQEVEEQAQRGTGQAALEGLPAQQAARDGLEDAHRGGSKEDHGVEAVQDAGRQPPQRIAFAAGERMRGFSSIRPAFGARR